jgi:dimethylargininase
MKHAIVRPPPSSFKRCISSHPLHHKLDLTLALKQHQEYCNILSNLGLELIELPINHHHPDSCFVEDTAVIFRDRAIITRMAKESRRGEYAEVEEALRKYKHLKHIEAPATIEGGDVIHLSNSLISGVTERTNNEGIKQASEWLRIDIEVMEDTSIVHLKSYVTLLDRVTVAVTERFAGHPLLRDYHRLIIPKDEEYAANTLAVNDVVLMSSQHPKSIKLARNEGFEVIPVNVSEFEKCEGALTCLSILF